MDPSLWSQRVEEANPARLLVRIDQRMSVALKLALSAEDIWQETLLHAWRDRGRHVWHGPASFRRWLLEVAENRIRDAVDRHAAQKRAGGLAAQRDPDVDDDERVRLEADWAVASSTPSRNAIHREHADLMRAALGELDLRLREVVWRRLFEEQGIEEIAYALHLSRAAVKHRLRKGSTLYRERLRSLLGSNEPSTTTESMTHP